MKNKLSAAYSSLITFLGILIAAPLAFAQSTSSASVDYSKLDEIVSSLSVNAVIIGTVLLVLLTAISLIIKRQGPGLKKLLFYSIILSTLLPTIFLAASTVYLNVSSSSGGPVHWHADFEFWNCGQELELKKPTGFSNKLGTATLHEHDDKRIHLEGVVVEERNASLGNFIKVIGGSISPTTLMLPTTSGNITMKSGEICANGEPGEFQVFAYHVNDDNTYSQRKISDPASFVIAPHSQVPPGDCIIMEFGEMKEKTDKLCRSYKVAKEIHKLGQEVMQ